MDQIELGDVAKDKISGFEGVVIAATEWLNGCRRITLAPQKLHEGKILEQETFDENQVVLVKSKKPPVEHLKATGGPQPRPVRSADPR